MEQKGPDILKIREVRKNLVDLGLPDRMIFDLDQWLHQAERDYIERVTKFDYVDAIDALTRISFTRDEAERLLSRGPEDEKRQIVLNVQKRVQVVK